MNRATLERHQVWGYLGALGAGVLAGALWPEAAPGVEQAVWPVLAALLFATFTQMRLVEIPRSFQQPRFLLAAVLGNFVLIPVLVLGLTSLVPAQPALVLGLLLVFLVPCTDWFITFSQLARGDAVRAASFTPVALLLQLMLLPLYLSLMADADVWEIVSWDAVVPALLVLLLPLAAAAATEVMALRSDYARGLRRRTAALPVPLLGLVILLVGASHVGPIQENLGLLLWVGLVGVLYLVGVSVLARLLARVVRLPTRQGRTLVLSFATRNSFIVLPFALALPAGWELTAVVIIMQSLVELLGMIFFTWFVPERLFPDAPDAPDASAAQAPTLSSGP